MKKGLFSLLVLLLIISCKNSTENQEVNGVNRNGQDSTSAFFYPISEYIQNQLAYVDSMPLAIEKQTFINGKRTDSVIIDRASFKQLATDFFTPNLLDAKLKPLYTATDFHDQTINTLTFSYNAKQADLPIQQRDILLVPETQKVKTVLFRKNEQHGDTSITINGLWTHNMNFQLNYIIEPGNGPMQTKQVKVIWDRPLPTNDY